MNIRPLHDRILVKRLSAEKTTASGLLIAVNPDKPNEAVVVAVGTGTVLPNGTVAPMSVKVGDKVLFTKHAGTEVKTFDDGEHLILREHEVLAVIEG